MAAEQKTENQSEDSEFISPRSGMPKLHKVTPVQEPEILSDEEEPKPEKNIPVHDEARWLRFKTWYKTDKKKSIPLSILVLLMLIVAIPWSRYHAAGLVIKKDFRLQVIDSTAHVPVSGAGVRLGSITGI